MSEYKYQVGEIKILYLSSYDNFIASIIRQI